MQQIKLFKSSEATLESLETEVNDWIRQSGAKVLNVYGNIAPQSTVGESKQLSLTQTAGASSDILLVILYETEDA